MYPLTFSYGDKESKKIVVSFQNSKEIKEFYTFVSTKLGAKWAFSLQTQNLKLGIPKKIATEGIKNSILGLIVEKIKDDISVTIQWGYKNNAINYGYNIISWPTFKSTAMEIINIYEKGNEQQNSTA
mgnify:FL=1